jgi:hypothetical protein
MPQPPSVGTLSKFILDAVNPPLVAYEYTAFNLGKHNTVLSTDGIRGTRSHRGERTRAGTFTISGSITMQPGPADWSNLWAFILGQAPTGAGTSISPFTFTPADKINSYAGASLFIGIDRIAQQHLFKNCQIDKATIRAQQGGFVDLELAIEGLTEQIGPNILGAGFAALVPSLATPLVFMDATMTNGGTTFQFRQVEVVIDNVLKKDRFMNGVSRSDLPALDRIVSVTLSLPYTSDQLALYDNNVTSNNVVLTFAIGGTNQMQIQLPYVQFPTEPPETPGREEILLPLKGIARATGTPEITVTNY